MSLHSMTAYGYGEFCTGQTTYTCEVRTLNSRFLEVNVRMPRHLMALEPAIINHAKTQFRRGKVDIFIDLSTSGVAKDLPELDTEAVRHYARLFDLLQKTLEKTLAASFASLQDPTPADFFRLDGVLQTGDKAAGQGRGPSSVEEHEGKLFNALNQAFDAVKAAREKEGTALAAAMSELVKYLDSERLAVAGKRDDILQNLQKAYIKRIENALAQLKKAGEAAAGEISSERLLMEVAVLSDKTDIDEEITRLGTHCGEFLRLIDSEEGADRKLDFICQEMHREVNTMSNKLVQTEVAQHTLEMKQTVERLRQQVQNIE